MPHALYCVYNKLFFFRSLYIFISSPRDYKNVHYVQSFIPSSLHGFLFFTTTIIRARRTNRYRRRLSVYTFQISKRFLLFPTFSFVCCGVMNIMIYYLYIITTRHAIRSNAARRSAHIQSAAYLYHIYNNMRGRWDLDFFFL